MSPQPEGLPHFGAGPADAPGCRARPDPVAPGLSWQAGGTPQWSGPGAQRKCTSKPSHKPERSGPFSLVPLTGRSLQLKKGRKELQAQAELEGAASCPAPRHAGKWHRRLRPLSWFQKPLSSPVPGPLRRPEAGKKPRPLRKQAACGDEDGGRLPGSPGPGQPWPALCQETPSLQMPPSVRTVQEQRAVWPAPQAGLCSLSCGREAFTEPVLARFPLGARPPSGWEQWGQPQGGLLLQELETVTKLSKHHQEA